MGKTAFALSMARNIAIDYKAVGFFIRNVIEQLVNRLIASEAQLEQISLEKEI